MSTGYLSAGHCWSTQAQAIDAHFSSQPIPMIYQPEQNGPVFMVIEKYSNQWYYTFYSHYGVMVNQTAADTAAYQIGTCILEETEVTYDYAAAMAAWSFAFITVMGFWLMAKNLGIVINAIKRW